MKKTLMFILTFVLAAAVLAGCSAPEDSGASGSGEETMPVYGRQLVDGVYEITVDSSSSMFRVVRCVLTVKDGSMSAAMTMSGQGYGMVYMGTGEEASQDCEESYIPFVLEESGAKTFPVPVEALDVEIDCAAWSIRKEKWYDRVLVFKSEGLPSRAFQVG